MKLGLSGYYQQSFQLLRDSLELVNLVDWFRAEPAKISEWRTADNKKLKREFGPAAVRSALETYPQYAGQKAGRDKVYALFSGLAVHATYKGFQLVAPGNAPKLGPFLDAPLLRALLDELGRHLSHATIGLSSTFSEDLDLPTLHAKAAYLTGLGVYHLKYIKRQGS